MDQNRMEESLISIASEAFRFQGVFQKVVSKVPADEQARYMSQYAWFAKKVDKALQDSGLRTIDITGKEYDTGMSVTPVNIDDFSTEDKLYIAQMVEPIIMQGNKVVKLGTVVLTKGMA